MKTTLTCGSHTSMAGYKRTDGKGRVPWSFRVPNPCWLDELARHINRFGKYVASFLKEWQIYRCNRKDDFRRSANRKDDK